MATINDYIGMYDKIFADIGGPVAQFYQAWREQMLSTAKMNPQTTQSLPQPQMFGSQPFAPQEEQQPQQPFAQQAPPPFKESPNPTGQYFPTLGQIAGSQNSLFQTVASTPQLGSGF